MSKSPGSSSGDFAESAIPAQNHSQQWQVLVAFDLFQFSLVMLSGKPFGISGDLPDTSKLGVTMQLPPTPDPWNTLELAKLVVGVLTPLSVAGLGWLVSRRLKRLDLDQWKNQKLIEKRLEIYDTVAPQLNLLLCFYTWVGYWKTISPEAVIQAKRDLDKTFNVYRHLFDDEVYTAYQSFIHTLFETYTGAGHDARIRSVVLGPDGDRSAGASAWIDEWSARFSAPDRVATKQEVRAKYQQLMTTLTHSFGVEHGDA